MLLDNIAGLTLEQLAGYTLDQIANWSVSTMANANINFDTTYTWTNNVSDTDNWTRSAAGVAQSTTYYRSSPNSLKFTFSGLALYAEHTVLDTGASTPGETGGNKGDGILAVSFRIPASTFINVYARATETGYRTCYGLWIRNDTTYAVAVVRRDTDGSNTLLSTAIGDGNTFVANGWYRVQLELNGTTIRAKIQILDDGTPENTGKWLQTDGTWGASEVWAITRTDATVTGAGYQGMVCHGGGPAYFDDFTWTDEYVAPTAGAITVKAGYPTATQIGLQIAATTGTGPTFSYQWYRSATVGGTYAAISGATSQELVHTPPGDAAYYYKCITTDETSHDTDESDVEEEANSPYVLKTAVAAAADVASGKPRWTGALDTANQGTHSGGGMLVID